MEDEKDSNQSLKPISRPHKDRYSTYSPNKFTGIGDKIKKKKVMFTDRAQNIPLCTVYNYEQVDLIDDDEDSPKSSSCVCFIF